MTDRSQPSKDPLLEGPKRILRRTTEVTTRFARRVSDDATAYAKKTAEHLSDVGGGAWDLLWDRSREMTETLVQATKDRLLPETRVHAVLLPTGGKPADFLCVLDFKDVVTQLAGGRFSRPCLEVWAARADVNRLALASNLRYEFTTQLQAERESLRQAAEKKVLPQVRDLSAEKGKAGNLVEAATFSLTASLLLLFTIANPIFDLVFLVLAVFSGAGGLTKALRYLRLSSQIRGNEKALKVEQSQLESELDAKNLEFLGAVENLEIKVHPVLERILVHICDLDGKPHVSLSEAEDEAASPVVDGPLKSARYRAALPELYHPLVEAELDSR